MNKKLLGGIALCFIASAAVAQDAQKNGFVPQGAGLDVWVDKNGDKLIQKDEVKPGSSLDTVFNRRDKNKDGALDASEYYMPGM